MRGEFLTALDARVSRLFVDRRFRVPRLWSNDELRRIGPHVRGDVVNVSAWDDRDKDGGHYREYFPHASSYHLTNYSGHRGFAGRPDEHFVDLMDDLPADLRRRFDVAFNHTTLEHIYEVRTAFHNLCELSRDLVIIVVPFSQVQHEAASYKDFWRFTPTCLRMMFAENDMDVVYEAESLNRRAAIYLLAMASRHPEAWQSVLPNSAPRREAGAWIGASRANAIYDKLRSRLSGNADTPSDAPP